GLADPTPYNHYSLLSTIQHALGLRCLAHSCDARHVAPMAPLFGGTAPAPAPGALSTVSSGRGHADPGSIPTGPRAAASPWHQVTSPDIGANDNSLGAISGRSASDIWAVGNYLPPKTPDVTATLAVHYNGHHWSAVPTPNVGTGQNTLLGVAAV